MNRKNLVIVLLIVLLLGAVVIVGAKPSQLSTVLVQSGEGPQTGLYGFNPPDTNTIYLANDQSMSAQTFGGAYYDWLSGSSVGLGTLQGNPATWVDVQGNTPQSLSTPFLGSGLNLQGQPSGQQISYFVTMSNGTKYHVTGSVYTDTLTLEFKANGSPNLSFHGGSLWFGFYVNIWGTQLCDPTNTSTCNNGYVWGAPLEAVITQSQVEAITPSGTSNSPTNDQINPMSQGANIPLYSGVTNQVPVGNGLPPDNTGGSVVGGSPLAPDQYMSQYTYGDFSLINFGPYGCGFTNLSVCYPDITLTITLYYLVIGQFLWTNPNTTPYHSSPQGSGCTNVDCAVGGLENLLSNPFVQLELAILLVVIVAVAVSVGVISLKAKVV